MKRMITVLSIAGSDPSSGAGVQADIKVFQALGVFGMAVPAAHTVQNSRGVSRAEPTAGRLLKRQLEALVQDVRPNAVKTGMLLSKDNVSIVAAVVKKMGTRDLVVDPVIRSSSGATLLEADGIAALRKKLFPLARVVTPNIPEAEVLSGMEIESEQDMDFAAGKILDMGPAYVLIKGGHRTGPATDTLYGGDEVLSFSTSRRSGAFHGTGCALSSSIAVFMARGLPVEKAVGKAKQFVDKLLKTAVPLGKSRTRYFLFP